MRRMTMSRAASAALLLLVMIVSLAPAQPPVVTAAADTNGGAAVDHAPSLEEIADRVERVYRKAKYIHMKQTAKRGGYTLNIRYDGTQDSLRTVCFNGSDLYGAFSLHEGRVQEFVPDHPKRLVLTYDCDMENQVPHLVYARPLDCLYGSTFGLWVGANSVQAKSFGERIRNGRYIGNQTIGGRPCHVIEHIDTFLDHDNVGEIKVVHTYYVDMNDYLMRRFDTVRDGDPQQRIYHEMIVSDEVPEIDWNIWPLVEETLRSAPQKKATTTASSE